MKKQFAKKMIMKFILGSSGCLLPIIILSIFVFGGIMSATTLQKKYDHDTVQQQADDARVPVSDYLYNLLYSDAVNEMGFSDQELEAMVFDRRSLKMMFEEIEKYNSAELTKTITLQYPGTKTVKRIVGYSYYKEDENGNPVRITRVEYVQRLNSGRVSVWSEPDYSITITPVSKDLEVILDNTWLQEYYPVQWQIVYLLCFYNSLDSGDESVEFAENGEKIRLKRNDIKEIIEDIAAEYTFEEYEEIVYGIVNESAESHVLDAVNYDWFWQCGFQVDQDEVRTYGAYKQGPSMEERTFGSNGRVTTTVYSGYIPLSVVESVQTLIKTDYYYSATDSIITPNGEVQDTYYLGTHEVVRTEYNLERLIDLIEKYGNGRDIDLFLYALETLPGGDEIVAEIEYAIMQVEEQ